MKKKVIALVLTAVMLFVAVALSACSKEKEPVDNPEGGTTTEAAAAADNNTDLDDVKAAGKLVIGITYFQPMNYFDDNNQLVGFETEFAEAVCAKLGVKAEFKEIIWGQKIIELNSKSIDCIWNGMTMNDDLAQQIDFSTPYMANKQVCVVKSDKAEQYKDLAAMSGASVVAEDGSAGESVAKADANLSANYLGVSAQADALKEVKAGTADVAVIDAVMAYSMVGDNTDFNDLTVLDLFDESTNEQYGVGFRKGSTLTPEVNKAMQELAADGTLNQIAKKYGLETRILIGA